MNEIELRKVSDEVARTTQQMDQRESGFLMALQLGRIVSHLGSEQRQYEALKHSIVTMEKTVYGDRDNPDKLPGLVSDSKEFRMHMAANRKLLWAVLGVALMLLGSSLWQMLTHIPVKP